MKRDATTHSQARKAWREYKQVRRDKSKAYYVNSPGFRPRMHLVKYWAIKAEQAWS